MNGRAAILLKMTTGEKASIRRSASIARQTMTAYILSVVLSRNDNGSTKGLTLPPEASEAVAAMVVAGISKNNAQRRIGDALKELPTGTTEELLHLAFRNGEIK